jgi:hypothetical protein
MMGWGDGGGEGGALFRRLREIGDKKEDGSTLGCCYMIGFLLVTDGSWRADHTLVKCVIGMLDGGPPEKRRNKAIANWALSILKRLCVREGGEAVEKIWGAGRAMGLNRLLLEVMDPEAGYGQATVRLASELCELGGKHASVFVDKVMAQVRKDVQQALLRCCLRGGREGWDGRVAGMSGGAKEALLNRCRSWASLVGRGYEVALEGVDEWEELCRELLVG